MDNKLKTVNIQKSKVKDRLYTQYNFSLFDFNSIASYIHEKGISLSQANNANVNAKENIAEDRQKERINISNDGRSCILCAVKFETHEEQKAHFKLDWHKYNIKQMLLRRNTVDERAFEELASGDVSSISGSDSESEEETTNNPLMTVSLLQSDDNQAENDFVMDKSNPKVYFVNSLGYYMSVYREALFTTKDMLKTTDEIVSKIENLTNEKVWVILMTGGGHFAGAVFSGNDVTVSKTFHRYTVRARRGTAQGIRDSKQGGHQPKSAGASLRRYNEAALVQDIQNLLESWNEHLENCDRIFIRVPNNYKWIFFEGKKPPLQKDDLRVRSIPFATRRATFKELKNVHEKLSTVYIHDNNWEDVCKKEQCSKESEAKKTCVNDTCVSRETELDPEDNRQKRGSNEDLKNSVKIKKNKKLSKKGQTEDEKQINTKEEIPATWIELHEAITSGNTQKVKCTLKEARHRFEVLSASNSECIVNKCDSADNETTAVLEENMNDISITSDHNIKVHSLCEDIFYMKFENYGGETLLHLASRLGESVILKHLLEAGADPTLKDLGGRVPFVVAKDKETRNVFRRYMASFPDKFDYKQAQIPSALTPEMEERENKKAAEKKKAQAKVRKERQKIKKAEEKQKENEKRKHEEAEKERNWFQNLSDREKRAVAADRRLGNICFNCSKRLQGIVAFERLSNKYCSTECVQRHRKLLETMEK